MKLPLVLVATARGIACAALLVGCAITPDRSALVPETYQLRTKHGGAVNVVVSGGEESDMLTGTNISNEIFAGALTDAISKSGLFGCVLPIKDTDFRLEVLIQRLSRGAAGFTVDARFSALWVLRAREFDRVLWQDVLVTTGSAGFGDGFSAPTVIRMAIERAAQKNIQRGIQEISGLSLTAAPPCDPKRLGVAPVPGHLLLVSCGETLGGFRSDCSP